MTSGGQAGAPRIVVVGGGLAGLRAALDCADGGAEVTLVERRSRLGGLTWSFRHDGRWIDNGQHVFLRCCTAYLDFLERIGSAGDVTIQNRLDVAVLRPVGRRGPVTGRLRRNGLPAPMHLAPALLGYPHLSVADRLRLFRAAWPLRSMELGDANLDTENFGAWLRRHGQTDRSIAALWDLITVATVNLHADEASLAMGAKVFQTGLLTETTAADIGWSRVPLGQLHGERAGAALAGAGVELSCDETVTAVTAHPDHSRWPFEVHSGRRTIEADAVVLAVPHHAAAALLPPAASECQHRWAELGTSAIINVHVVFDRAVTALPLAAGVGTGVQWVFDRTASSGLLDSGTTGSQYLAASLSAADSQLSWRPDDLGTRVVRDLARLFPAVNEALVLDTFVTKERHATFRAVPGTARLRPGPLTRIPGLVLAGAWTDTGWPATMEGAVRSGRTAARCALAAAGSRRALPEEVA